MQTGRVTRLILAAVMLLAAGSTARAQVSEGRFTGTVIDGTGAAVPGTTIVVKNERTGEERSATANPQGRFLVAGLRPSVYTIRATYDKFAPLEYRGLQLLAAQEVAIDLQLQAAGVTENVTVRGDS